MYAVLSWLYAGCWGVLVLCVLGFIGWVEWHRWKGE